MYKEILKKYSLLFVVLVVHVILLLKISFTAWPEIFSFPYLVNNGYKLYLDFVHPYPPLLTYLLSVIFNLFGYNIFTLRFLTYLSIIVSDVVIYKIVFQRTKSHGISLLAIVFYVLSQPFLEGNMLWFDNAIVLPLLLSIYYLQKKKILLFSLCVFIALLIKQTVAIYILVFCVYFLISKEYKNLRTFLTTLIGGSFIVFILLLIQGNLESFFMWAFWYPFKYWSRFPGYILFNLTRREIITCIMLSIPPLVAIYKKAYLVSALYLAALIGVYPRFSFFHLQPAIAMSAIALGIVQTKSKYMFVSSAFVLILFLYIWKGGISFGNIRFLSESEKITAQKIDDQRVGQSLFLLGLPSQYYVLTHTLPPKPWLDNYGWYYEMPGEEDKVIKSFTSSPPNTIVWSDRAPGNWYDLGTYEPKRLTEWISAHYMRSIEISSGIWIWKQK